MTTAAAIRTPAKRPMCVSARSASDQVIRPARIHGSGAAASIRGATPANAPPARRRILRRCERVFERADRPRLLDQIGHKRRTRADQPGRNSPMKLPPACGAPAGVSDRGCRPIRDVSIDRRTLVEIRLSPQLTGCIGTAVQPFESGPGMVARRGSAKKVRMNP
jgi:hypothetical protein